MGRALDTGRRSWAPAINILSSRWRRRNPARVQASGVGAATFMGARRWRGSGRCLAPFQAQAASVARRFHKEQDMRMRENRPTMEDSISTTLEVAGREQMVRHIFDALGKKGVVVTDEMVHVSHYGFDERIDWDEHIIVVERFGVFGFTDCPCPYAETTALAPSPEGTAATAERFSAEVESAYRPKK
jgi:hypothetical protein